MQPSELLIKGTFAGSEKLSPEEVSVEAIKILSSAAQQQPIEFLKHIRDAVELKLDRMVPLALAVLTAQAQENILARPDVEQTIISILGYYGTPKLLEYVEYLRSKTLGKGFGSRPQRWVRTVMESWNLRQLEYVTISATSQTYDLIRLVHPRYKNERGKFLKETFRNWYSGKIN